MALQQVKPQTGTSEELRDQSEGFSGSLRHVVKQILIIGLGVAFGELLVRFVWSVLIWQWIQRNLP